MPTIKLPPSRAKAAKSAPKNGNGARRDYYVKDISLADLGRREIGVAEQEMPGAITTSKTFLSPTSAVARSVSPNRKCPVSGPCAPNTVR